MCFRGWVRLCLRIAEFQGRSNTPRFLGVLCVLETRQALELVTNKFPRLCRLPCGKPMAFRHVTNALAAMPPEAKPLSRGIANGKPEAFRKGVRQSRLLIH
jgi:hypothetical protein